VVCAPSREILPHIFGNDSLRRIKTARVETFQYATLTAQRSAISDINPFNPAELVNLVSGTNEIFGAYVTDTFSPNTLLHITAAARYNRSIETLNGYSLDTDVGDFGDGFDEPNPLFGNHTFVRVNPSLGFTVTPTMT
jgi:TonB dependent receptor